MEPESEHVRRAHYGLDTKQILKTVFSWIYYDLGIYKQTEQVGIRLANLWELLLPRLQNICPEYTVSILELAQWTQRYADAQW